jgi:hypothetical protein
MTFDLSNSKSKTPNAGGLYDFAKVKFGKLIFFKLNRTKYLTLYRDYNKSK